MSDQPYDPTTDAHLTLNMGGLPMSLPGLAWILQCLKDNGRVAVFNCGPIDPFLLGVAIGLKVKE